MHFQLPPYSQAKLVRCVVGEVYDVAVDIRKDSKTFGKWVGVNISAENRRQLWIPEGFAHGFEVISDVADFLYKTNNFYNAKMEKGIRWDDEFLAINWKEEKAIISDKDMNQPSFKELFEKV